ncbi:MAG TPA: zinc-binding alcohol dehydrogenase family protein [Puia sp.]|jgi:2-desacetyl-2-hydroxyethyl bacteriochlorophyllide A dehydrogenase|nr:zinc-binding alcohol dehydrogenase family protein [Puia sp.]
MKVLTCTKPGLLEYDTRDLPGLKPGNTLLRIKRIGICGTDLHAYEGTQPYFNYPRVLGHEIAGEIISTDAPGFEGNESVTVIPYFNCNQCIACRKGKPNCCVDIRVCGVHVDGAMVEYLSVPSYSLVHGEYFNDDELALVEPLAIGAHAVRRAAVKENETVLVVGAGPIGLATMELARVAGAVVIAIDVNAARLNFCGQNLNIKHLIHAASPDIVAQLKDITNGDMPDALFDATGNLNAISGSFRFIAHGGRYVLVGLQKDEICFSHPEFHKREATLMSSRNATREDFAHVMDCIRQKLISPARFITHRMQFDEVKNLFADLLNPASGAIKAMVEFDQR